MNVPFRISVISFILKSNSLKTGEWSDGTSVKDRPTQNIRLGIHIQSGGHQLIKISKTDAFAGESKNPAGKSIDPVIKSQRVYKLYHQNVIHWDGGGRQYVIERTMW